MLGLLWYLQRAVAKRSGRKADATAIRVLGRQGLGAKAQLVVVQTDDARYVLGVTEHGVTVVDRIAPDGASAGEAARTTADEAAKQPQFRASAPEAQAEHASPDDAFAALLASSRATVPADSPQLRQHQHPQLRVRHRADPLRGSILSPETWRQTAEALRRTR